MDQQKIDRLFREKMDGYEVTPSNQAWLEVERKIDTKRSTTKFYWMAAAVSAIILSWVVWPTTSSESFTPIASEVNHPEPSTQLVWEIPVIEKEVKRNLQPKIIDPSTVQLVAHEPINDQVKEILEEAIEETPQSEVDLTTTVAEVNIEEESAEAEVAVEADQPQQQEDEKIKVDLSKVKITYIAANTTEKKQEKDSVGAFKKFISFAGKLSPGDVLADLKTKKDDFINGGFRTKEKEQTSL